MPTYPLKTLHHSFRLALLLVCSTILSTCSPISSTSRSMSRSLPSAFSLYFETINTANRTGPSIVMLHGFGASSFTWRHIAPLLATSHRVFLIDLLGFGRSPKPLASDYSINHQAELVFNLILKNDINSPILVGHSFGGGVALLVALKMLEESRLSISGIILLDTIAYHHKFPLFLRILRTPIVNHLSTRFIPPAMQVRQVLSLAYHDDTKITPDQIAAYAEPIASEGGRHALIETAKQIVPQNVDAITKNYQKIDVPVLLIWGQEDQIINPEIGKKLQLALSDAELRIVPEAGHLPHEERPLETFRIIQEFLERVEPEEK